MRLSLLLKREPLGWIIEETLARFWQAQHGQSYRVRWYQGRPDLKVIDQRGEQVWLGNIYLNAIFIPETEPSVFDPIKREFARSLVRWRRPLQRVYITLAVSRLAAPRLAQVGLGVAPPVPGAQHKLIVAGNHKLRLLDHRNGLVYGILKEGANPDFLRREIETRQLAESLGLPVPPLVQMAQDGTWFSERYLVGVPINRLADLPTAGQAALDAAGALTCLITQTRMEELLVDYVTRLHRQVQALLRQNHLLPEARRRNLWESTNTLVSQINDLRSTVGGRITTALTHGDFQPANILANDKGAWLIDWEYSARRQAGYDALVFMLGSRFPGNLADRLQRFVVRGPDATAPLTHLVWPGVDWQRADSRRLSGILFLLEELALHLVENANSNFGRLGEGLTILTREIARWLSGGIRR